MTISRRQFLKHLLVGAGVAAVPGVLAACRPVETPAPGPASPGPLLTQPAATATSRLPATPTEAAPTQPAPTVAPTAPGGPQALGDRNRKKVWAWLRMVAADTVPTSEADYRANLRNIDVAMPLNGGKLQEDGTWLQEDAKVGGQWPRSLPQLARSSGHLYMPGMGNDRQGTQAVLASTSLQDKAAQKLVELATNGRFDSPWDGVYLDLEGIPYANRSAMSGFLFRLAKAVKDAGLLLGISVGGVTPDATGTSSGDDAMDLGVAGELADFVDLRCYDYGGPLPGAIGPYWWIESCIRYALEKKNVRPGQMTVGLANFSQYWPNSEARDSQQMTYDAALQLVRQSGAQIQWVESDDNGPVRESVAQIGQGHACISDERSYRFGLNLIDQYKVLGNTMFAPGMGSAAQWQTVSAWLAGNRS